MKFSEAEFQRALLLTLNRTKNIRAWRQNSGTVPLRGVDGVTQRVFRAGPPKGACDITGIASPSGLRIEIEVKSETGKTSAEQLAWGGMIVKYGGVFLEAKPTHGESVCEATDRVVNHLQDLIRFRERG